MSEISRAAFESVLRAEPVQGSPSPRCFVGLEEVEILKTLINCFRLSTVVEIGCNEGGTARLLLAECPSIRRYIGIEVPASHVPALQTQAGETPHEPGQRARNDQRFELIVRPRGAFDLMPRDFPSDVDFVFIDGDHSAAAVKHDTELARQLIRGFGVIAWHDYGNAGAEITAIIDELNRREGDHICLVSGTWTCFEIRQAPWAGYSSPLCRVRQGDGIGTTRPEAGAASRRE